MSKIKIVKFIFWLAKHLLILLLVVVLRELVVVAVAVEVGI
jgi:hypothetical protein